MSTNGMIMFQETSLMTLGCFRPFSGTLRQTPVCGWGVSSHKLGDRRLNNSRPRETTMTANKTVEATVFTNKLQINVITCIKKR